VTSAISCHYMLQQCLMCIGKLVGSHTSSSALCVSTSLKLSMSARKMCSMWGGFLSYLFSDTYYKILLFLILCCGSHVSWCGTGMWEVKTSQYSGFGIWILTLGLQFNIWELDILNLPKLQGWQSSCSFGGIIVLKRSNS
jgi:hypothetical protein